MTRVRFVLRSFFHYGRLNLLVALGVALATAILSGALMIGDSMRYSLEQITLSRLGNISHLVSVNDRYFRAALANDLEKSIARPVAPLLQLDGMAVSEGGARRVNQIKVNGVDDNFGRVAGTSFFDALNGDDVAISENLARKLEVREGDAILIRISKASLMPRNTPFVSESETTVTLRATFRIADRQNMALFNLQNSQQAPYNLFMPLDRLNRLMEFEGRANRLLVSGDISTEHLSEALGKCLRPEDAGLVFRSLPATAEIEISTERVFLEDPVASTYVQLPESRPLMTYFVNAISKEGKSVPYSFASSRHHEELAPDEILVNDWVAEDLSLSPRDSVQVSWFEVGPLRQLEEKHRMLAVKRIVPLLGAYADSTLMPSIPGISDAGHCREWEAGVPVDLSLIRKKDEDYWNRYRGTPKIFVSPELALEAWSNRFGNYTAVRFPSEKVDEEYLRAIFALELSYGELGFSIHAVREKGLKAARGGVYFGKLFLGLSFFLLLSAILLISLLFRLNLEGRSSQFGSLLQVGFHGKTMTQLLLAEALLIIIPGILAGLFLAWGYVKIVFLFLNTLWWDIVRTPVILVTINPGTLLTGVLLGSVIALVSVYVPLRIFLRRQVADLHRGTRLAAKTPWRNTNRIPLLLIVAAVMLVVWQLIAGESADPLFFFLSGGLLLAGLLTGIGTFIAGMEKYGAKELTLEGLNMRLIARNRGRSMTVIILFALATFLVVAIGANRQEMYGEAAKPASGSGGYSHFAETAVPVLYDLNDPQRRLTEGLDSSYRVVQFHRIAGDDASCLNLNKIENPVILGFDAEALRGRFTFSTHTPELDRSDPWMSLKKQLPGGLVPAIADQTVIQWGLMMKVGDTLLYQQETGDTLRIKLIGGLAPSIFQGYILIDNTHFLTNYPSHSGSSVFLIDPDQGKGDAAAEELGDLLRDNGFEVTSAPARLAEFYSVTNTYLAIFLALGILALALGTVGLGIVVARSVLERKQELATLLALGFRRAQVVSSILKEYAFLLVSGVLTGLLAAFTAVMPVFINGNTPVSAGTVLVMISLIVMNGFVWVILLARSMVKSHKLLPALREL